jgi:hypothetical protein
LPLRNFQPAHPERSHRIIVAALA